MFIKSQGKGDRFIFDMEMTSKNKYVPFKSGTRLNYSYTYIRFIGRTTGLLTEQAGK